MPVESYPGRIGVDPLDQSSASLLDNYLRPIAIGLALAVGVGVATAAGGPAGAIVGALFGTNADVLRQVSSRNRNDQRLRHAAGRRGLPIWDGKPTVDPTVDQWFRRRFQATRDQRSESGSRGESLVLENLAQYWWLTGRVPKGSDDLFSVLAKREGELQGIDGEWCLTALCAAMDVTDVDARLWRLPEHIKGRTTREGEVLMIRALFEQLGYPTEVDPAIEKELDLYRDRFTAPAFNCWSGIRPPLTALRQDAGWAARNFDEIRETIWFPRSAEDRHYGEFFAGRDGYIYAYEPEAVFTSDPVAPPLAVIVRRSATHAEAVIISGDDGRAYWKRLKKTLDLRRTFDGYAPSDGEMAAFFREVREHDAPEEDGLSLS